MATESRAATRDERSEIRAAVLCVPEVAPIGRLLTMQLSPHIESEIPRAVPAATRMFIEPEAPR